jgi:hypothetical protein
MENHILTMALSGRVSHSSSGDRRVPRLRKASMVWIWQHYKKTDDYKIILNLCKKIDEKLSRCAFFDEKCIPFMNSTL